MSRWGILLIVGILATTNLGCGGAGGPPRFSLSGAVTFQGQPVPTGSIVFAPDPSKGNKGPGTTVQIVNGKYHTESGMGVIGGPMRIRFSCAPLSIDENNPPTGKPMFEEVEIEMDIPQKSGQQDFVVPLKSDVKARVESPA